MSYWFSWRKTPPPQEQEIKPEESEAILRIQKEYERKLEAMTVSLHEMSSENTALYAALKAKEEVEKSARARVIALEAELETQREMQKELQRRLEAMTRVLEDLILQNSSSAQRTTNTQLSGPFEAESFVSAEEAAAAQQKHSVTHSNAQPSEQTTLKSSDTKTPESPAPAVKRITSRRRVALENIPDDKPVDMPVISVAVPVNLNDVQLEESEQRNPLLTAKRYKAENAALKKEVFKLQQMNDALSSAIDKYDAKLVKAEKQFRENLLKESRRRKDAEYVCSVLKKRVEQLQYLLDHQDSSDDSDASSSDAEQLDLDT